MRPLSNRLNKICAVPSTRTQRSIHFSILLYNAKNFWAHLRSKLYFITNMPNFEGKFCESIYTALFMGLIRPTLLENLTIHSVARKRTFRWSFFLSPSFHCFLLNCNAFDFIYYLSFCLLYAINHTIYEILLCLCEVRKYSISFHWIDCRNLKSLNVRTCNSV